jgi:hypothetical protein
MAVLSVAAKDTLFPGPIIRARTLAPTLGSIYENDLTHSNAASARRMTITPGGLRPHRRLDPYI